MSQLFSDLSEPRIVSYAVADGSGSNINITSQNMSINDSSFILASTVGKGDGGTLTMKASGDINLTGGTIRDSNGGLSTVVSASTNAIGSTNGTGKGGNIIINAQNLNLVTGGIILSPTLGLDGGRAGDITVNVTDSISLIGETETFAFLSEISSTSLGGGKTGNVEINTGSFLIQDGGKIAAGNQSTGASGNIILNASESVTVEGSYFSPRTQSNILSEIRVGTIRPTPSTRTLFGLDPNPSGDSGSVIINSPVVNVANDARIIAVNEGTGDGGEITITGDKLNLANQASILTTTESGTGGVINLNLDDIISLRSQSQINAESLITGNGGNININSPVILGLENSDIIANAVDGNGGNINITTSGIFGLENRDSLTDGSDITASSQFGVNGTVNINNFGTDPSSGLVKLPVNTTDKSQQIASGCADTSGSSFIATGRGGIPTNPNQEIKSDRTWSDVRDISAYRQNKPVTAQIPAPANPVIQATSWRRNAQGEVELIAENSATAVQQNLTCAAVPKS